MFNKIEKCILWTEKQLINGITYLSKTIKKTSSFWVLLTALIILNTMSVLLIALMILAIVNTATQITAKFIGDTVKKTWYDARI